MYFGCKRRNWTKFFMWTYYFFQVPHALKSPGHHTELNPKHAFGYFQFESLIRMYHNSIQNKFSILLNESVQFHWIRSQFEIFLAKVLDQNSVRANLSHSEIRFRTNPKNFLNLIRFKLVENESDSIWFNLFESEISIRMNLKSE